MEKHDKTAADRFYEEIRLITAGGDPVMLIDHTTHAPDDQDIRTVEWAVYGGWKQSDADLAQHLLDIAGDWSDVDRADRLIWRAEAATEYLNDHCCPTGWWFGHDPDVGAYGVWPVKEEV